MADVSVGKVRNAAVLAVLAGACSAMLMAGCGAVGAQPRAASQPGSPSAERGFRNSDGDPVEKSFFDLMRWRWQRLLAKSPDRVSDTTPVVAADLPFIHANAVSGAGMAPAITWIGHATMLVQASGLNVLTDPVFAQRASPLSWIGPMRLQAPGLSLRDLPHIDVVVISHNHYDHLDLVSVRTLAAQPGGSPLFLVPLGLKSWMSDNGIGRVEELDWWDSRTWAGVQFTLTPSQHWSQRTPWDRDETLWGGWAVIGTDFHWFFAGDTGYSKDFARIREHFADRQLPVLGGGFDIALVPIGAYEPRWFMQRQHVNPEEAIRIHGDLGAKRSVGVHWGTFPLSDEASDQPPRDLANARVRAKIAPDNFFVMAIGQTQRLAVRPLPQKP